MSDTKFERYEAYKDSGVEWISEVPAHWKVKRIKKIFVESKAKSSTGDEILLSVSEYTGVTQKQDNIGEDEFVSRAESLVGYKICKIGDLVINIMLAWKRGLGVSAYQGIVSPSYAVYSPLKKVSSSFFHYLLRSENAIAEFKRNSTGIIESRLRLYTDSFYALSVACPSFKEQTAIANYLDSKTAQIDSQIDLLSQKATQYGKLKQSLIKETVTRGLDKTVEMKDSGVEWIGGVPVHWEVKRVKELGNLVLGKMLDNNQGSGKFLKSYLKSKNIGWLIPTISDVEEMYFSHHEISLYRIKQDDLLFSEGGEVGKTSYWSGEIDECYIQNSVHKFTANKYNCSRYFLYVSFAAGHVGYYDSIVNFVSIKHLTKEKLSRVIWPSPPINEQKTIANYLDKKTTQIDRIVATINTQVEKLKELRKTMINDVVTGKIKVVKEGQAA